MALPRVLDYVQEFIWGHQYRLVGSRAILRTPGRGSQLTQGGDADPRRYARYRCFGDGQFRCLMITCLIALTDTADNDGVFCAIPASHKASLPHPYENTDLNAISPLHDIPLRAGSGILFTENLSHAFKPAVRTEHVWLSYQYGPLVHGQLARLRTFSRPTSAYRHRPRQGALVTGTVLPSRWLTEETEDVVNAAYLRKTELASVWYLVKYCPP